MADPRPATQTEIRAAQLVERLWGSADLGPKVREEAKRLFPDIQLPEEAPAIAPIAAESAAMRARLEKLEADIAARDAKAGEEKTFRELEQAVNTAVSKFGLTDEGRAAMLDRMKETKNFTDVEAAAAWVAHSKPPAPTAGPSWAIGNQRANLFGSAEKDERFKALHLDPEGYLESELRAFAADPDRYTSDTLGRAA